MNYDAIVVLGAVMQWDKKFRKWKFPTIIDGYSGKLVMGHARACAASLIAHKSNRLLITGGSDTNPETGKKDSRAIELAKLITDRYKVPVAKVTVIGQSQSGHTQGNVENVVAYLSQENLVSFKNVAVLSPAFQVERAKIMFEENNFFLEQGIALHWLIVEDLLEKYHRLFSVWRKSVYKTLAAEVCESMEKQGIKALKAKKYVVKS